jgi:hypothetical protein
MKIDLTPTFFIFFTLFLAKLFCSGISWFWVFFPLWIGPFCVLCLYVALGVIALIAHIMAWLIGSRI